MLMAKTEIELLEKAVKWKAGTEVEGLKINTSRKKVMFSCGN